MANAAESPCRRCAKTLARSCCEVADGDALATLTRADIERLEEAGWRRAAFVEEEWLTPEEALAAVERRPIYAGYYDAGPRRLTLRRRDGACVFFAGGKGCALSEADRPTACRLYPFDLAPSGLALQVDRFESLGDARAAASVPGGAACLAVQEASGWESLTAAFGTNEAAVRALGDRLRDEVREHARGARGASER